MTETGQNFQMHQGDFKQVVVEIKDANDSPVDLSLYNSVWVVYKQTTKELILSKSFGDGITYSGVNNQFMVITLLPADTENISPAVYNHEGEISDGGTLVSTVFTGIMKVLYSKA